MCQSSLLIGWPCRINSIICLLAGSADSEWQGPAPAPAHLGTLILIHYALGNHHTVRSPTTSLTLVVMCSVRPDSFGDCGYEAKAARLPTLVGSLIGAIRWRLPVECKNCVQEGSECVFVADGGFIASVVYLPSGWLIVQRFLLQIVVISLRTIFKYINNMKAS